MHYKERLFTSAVFVIKCTLNVYLTAHANSCELLNPGHTVQLLTAIEYITATYFTSLWTVSRRYVVPLANAAHVCCATSRLPICQ